jgi:hypothetical protein
MKFAHAEHTAHGPSVAQYIPLLLILLVTGLIVFAVFRANSKNKNSDEDKNEL